MDIVGQIAKTRRRVEDGSDEKAVILTRTYETSVEDLWDACTDPDRLSRWFEPVSGDLREGGRFELASGSGGTIDHCDPPTRLRLTWEFEGESSRVEVALSGAEGRATLHLEHHAPEDEQWRTYGPGAGGVGWDIAVLSLALYLAGDARAEPSELEKLFATDEGTASIRQAAASWAEAHVAAGADERSARAAAERTADTYAGAGPDAPS